MFLVKAFLRVLVAALALLLALPFAHAATQQPFDTKAFQAAQESGKPVLVEIHADWCPTCKAQLPILNKLANEAGFANITRFRVDFDAQKDAVKRFGTKMQSTLVLFKGKTEVARSVGETDEARIRAMLAKAL